MADSRTVGEVKRVLSSVVYVASSIKLLRIALRIHIIHSVYACGYY